MSKRRYTRIEQVKEEVLEMLTRGKTQREVAEHFGFADKKEFCKYFQIPYRTVTE